MRSGPEERERLREQATAVKGQDDASWCRVQLFDLIAAWDEADVAERTRLLAELFERVEAQVYVPDPGTKFSTKRQADAVASSTTWAWRCHAKRGQ